MKIGILTYHRAENYGALLQAYALKTYIHSLGHDVSFVDYWPKYHEEYFKLFPLRQFKHRKSLSRLKFIVKLLVWFVPRFIRKKRMQRFMHERLEVTDKILYRDGDRTEQYDIVVYGSDQIWRKQNLGGVGFDSWYFGADNVLAKKKIVYAGSMGIIDTDCEDDNYIRTMMSQFNLISVREKDLQSYLGMLNISAETVIDPVFLLSKEQWHHITEKKKSEGKYILFYNLLNTKDSKQFADKLGSETGLPIKEINKKMVFDYRRLGKRYISTASVPKFLRLVQDAEFVVSNSFHGVAFSIIFQKQFFAVGMHQKATRVITLLDLMGLSDRYINAVESYVANIRQIDYKVVVSKMQQQINRSKLFINESLAAESVS